MSKTKTVYTCGVVWQHELGEVYVKVYDSVESLKKHKPCWDTCGIVELKVSLKKWVEPQDLLGVKDE